MSPKEKIQFVRSSEFETVEDDLMSAMERLDSANARIDSLLSSRELDGLESQARSNAACGETPMESAPSSAEEKAPPADN